MSTYELGNLILQVLTFTVLTVILWKLHRYTASTQDLARAAVEEMSRPCVQVFQDIDETNEGVIGGHSASIVDMDYLAFRNIGTAPALNFRYEVQTSQAKPYSSTGPSLLPGQVFTSNAARNALRDPEATVVCEFETLSGAKYRTKTVIQNRRWVKHTRFETGAA
jgi:hypothetical protein